MQKSYKQFFRKKLNFNHTSRFCFRLQNYLIFVCCRKFNFPPVMLNPQSKKKCNLNYLFLSIIKSIYEKPNNFLKRNSLKLFKHVLNIKWHV